MFSVQRVLGEDKRFYKLLEASADDACESVAALRSLLDSPQNHPTLETFATLRRKDKELTNEIAELLIHALVVATEREDVEALAHSLYRIPKTVEKFAERYIISLNHVADVDFSRQVTLMERGCRAVAEMIPGLRQGATVAVLKQQNANIQKIESDADDVMLEFMAKLYEPDYPKLKAVIVKDLFELNEKVVDRCRDAGNVIVRVALKNS